MRIVIALCTLLGTQAVAAAEPAPRQPPQTQPTSDQGQRAAPPPRPARIVQETANDHGRQLTACFTSTKPARKVSMIVVVASDGTKVKSRVKQSVRATKQIEACVVDVFDHIAFRLPPRPVIVEVPVAYDPQGA